MEHTFPSESFQRENRTTFSEVPLIPEIFQWNEPKTCVLFTFQPEFPEFLGKWKTPLFKSLFAKAIYQIKKARAERAKQLVLQINYAELGHSCWPALLFVSFELEGGRRRWMRQCHRNILKSRSSIISKLFNV